MILMLLVLALVAIIAGLVIYARWDYGTLEKMGIPVVKPHWFLGSLWDAHKYVSSDKDAEIMRQYGDVVGVYDGRLPQVWIADPEMVKHVTVKDYDHFRDRRTFEFGDKMMNETMDFQPYPKWKLTRTMLSPLFTVSRLKGMNDDINAALDFYTKNLDSEIDSSPNKRRVKMDIYSELFEMVSDIIARTVFSMPGNNANGKIITDIMKQYILPVRSRGDEGIIGAFVAAFPFIGSFFPFFDPKAADSFIKVFTKVVDSRRTGAKKDDMINQMLKMLDQVDSDEYKQAGVTELTVMAQSAIFFFAGQDQFAMNISGLAYYLSKNEGARKKLEAELDAFMERHQGKLEHEHLGELLYTNACILETVRLLPPFSRPERLCVKDWTYGKLTIKKGTIVSLPLAGTNRHPKHFANPDEFNPDRFMPGNPENDNRHPYAFSSFGHGPKNCIAYKYNLEVLRMMAARLFYRYRFKAGPYTKLELKKGTGLISVFDDVFVDAERRN